MKDLEIIPKSALEIRKTNKKDIINRKDLGTDFFFFFFLGTEFHYFQITALLFHNLLRYAKFSFRS